MSVCLHTLNLLKHIPRFSILLELKETEEPLKYLHSKIIMYFVSHISVYTFLDETYYICMYYMISRNKLRVV